MVTLVIAAALASIGITALLTGLLVRLNRPMLEQAKRDKAAGDGGVHISSSSDRRDADHSSDDGGSDGGGDGGGD